MLNVLVAVRLFAKEIEGSTLHIRSDNAASIAILQTGRGNCKSMLECARQIWMLAAQHRIQFRVSHIFGRDNVVADVLSRRHLGSSYETKLDQLKLKFNPTFVEMDSSLFML